MPEILFLNGPKYWVGLTPTKSERSIIVLLLLKGSLQKVLNDRFDFDQ